MNISQQKALISLSEKNYDLIQEKRFNKLIGKLDSEDILRLKEYDEALKSAFAVFKKEFDTLRYDDIKMCLENTLVKEEHCQGELDERIAKRAGRLQKKVNNALRELMQNKPDFILYPAFSRFGLIPKGELSVIEIIDPTECSKYIDFRPDEALENCLVKINNHHSFSRSRFLAWSKDMIDIFQGVIRLFSVVNGCSDVRHILFFYQYEMSGSWQERFYVSRNDSLENNEIFSFPRPKIHRFLEHLKTANLVVVLDSLLSQEFLDDSLANNVRFALSRFNRAIESHDDCEAIVNLCSSLEAISNKLYPKNVCEKCDSQKVSEGLKNFLNLNAFQQTGIYYNGIDPMKVFNQIYDLRSKIVHGSLKRNEADTLKGYMPKAFRFVATTIYILLQNAYKIGFDSPVPLQERGKS
ncbi:hypothetical protein [Shewanella chilikensis]|uniref:hypothetical protein n=1 Tax=Shewanella chilikensis TaxID=558541 RepID=UPI00399C3199